MTSCIVLLFYVFGFSYVGVVLYASYLRTVVYEVSVESSQSLSTTPILTSRLSNGISLLFVSFGSAFVVASLSFTFRCSRAACSARSGLFRVHNFHFVSFGSL